MMRLSHLKPGDLQTNSAAFKRALNAERPRRRTTIRLENVRHLPKLSATVDMQHICTHTLIRLNLYQTI